MTTIQSIFIALLYLVAGTNVAAAADQLGAQPGDRIFYGSRIGMTVTVTSVTALDTANALIAVDHTKQDAEDFCTLYVGKLTDACVAQELAVELQPSIVANCDTGEFTSLYGVNFRFLGRNTPSDQLPTDYLLLNVDAGELANGSSASGYDYTLMQFFAACPVRQAD